MIDINELRRKLHSGDIVDHIDIHANVNPILTELLDRLEAADKDIALKERIIDSLGSELNAVANERDELRARIDEMEKQEPVGIAGPMPGTSGFTVACFSADEVPVGTKLYALPGAKGE